LRESINVHKQLDRHRYIARLAKDILDSSPRGMIVLSSDGVIQMANSKAEQILTASDGISRKADKLVIDDREGKNVLHEHLSLNMNSYPPGETDAAIEWNLAIKRPSGASDYQIILGTIKLQEWHIESRGSDRIAIVYIHDPENKSGPTLEQLKSFYGFTDAQARLAATLYSGHSMTEAADSLNISINTARSHIRNIYQKIGVSTQAELLGLLASGLKTYGTRRN